MDVEEVEGSGGHSTVRKDDKRTGGQWIRRDGKRTGGQWVRRCWK